jgi:transposase
MRTVKLPNEQWKKVLAFLRTCSGIRIGSEAQCRCFVEGVLWMARSGAQWRLLPGAYGDWNAVYKRFARWCDLGIWEQMHTHFANDPDMESLMIDPGTGVDKLDRRFLGFLSFVAALIWLR